MKTCYEQLKPEIKELIEKEAEILPYTIKDVVKAMKNETYVSNLTYYVYVQLTSIKSENSLFDYFEKQI